MSNSITLTVINTKEQNTEHQYASKSPFTLGTKMLPHINDKTVEADHAFISKPYQQWTITNQSANGTYVRIPRNTPVRVQYGQLITCGLTWIDTSDPNSISIVDSDFQLIAHLKPRLNYEYLIGQGRCREHIGNRSDPVISHQHAKLIFHETDITVIDNSTDKIESGTYISIRNETELTNDMIIRIGNYTFCKVSLT